MENKFENKIKIGNEDTKFTLCERLSTTINDLSYYKQSKDISSIKYLECMACCHSLTMLNNLIIGDPLETEMFKVTQWILEHEMNRNPNRNSLVFYPKNSEYKLKQVCQFDFLPELQRMSVVAKNNYDSKFNLYVKGSPEKIFELCKKDSLPKDFFEVLKRYTESGKRVIAFAFRELKGFNEEAKHDRSELEQDLVFLGFLIFLNKLKPESISSIEKLKKGNVTTMMATGDNLLTGIAMAKACGILTSESVVTVDLNQSNNEVEFKMKKLKKENSFRDSIDSNINKSDNEEIVEESKLLDNKHSSRLSQASRTTQNLDSLYELMQGEHINSEIAITGKAFEHLIELRPENTLIDGYRIRDIIKRILMGGRVYARMTPDHKELLIKELQDETGENIGMCGDGANDCKALKVADVGLSLSEAEASIAAPFTSNVQNISSAVELLKLGRFSLDISFSLMQIMFLYTCTQFCNLIFTYYFASRITDFQYVYVDLCCLMPITIFVCWIDPKPELVKDYPPNSLLDPRVFFSIFGHLVITISGIIGIYVFLIHQKFYTPHVLTSSMSEENQESTTIFLYTLPLYIGFGIMHFTTSKFKESIFAKFSFDYLIIICYLIIQIGITYWIILYPLDFMKEAISIVTVPITFRAVIACATVCTFILYMIYEHSLYAILNKLVPQKSKKIRKVFKKHS